MTFEEYFSFKAIVGDLIRWRVAGKGTRGAGGRSDVEETLPPRRMWSRAGAKARKGGRCAGNCAPPGDMAHGCARVRERGDMSPK